MKKVLIIAFAFPPYPAIGSQRPYGLAKYLPKYGWDPVILTVKCPGKRPEGIKVIETDYRDIIDAIKSRLGVNASKEMHAQSNHAISKNGNLSSLKSTLIKLTREIITFPDESKGWSRFACKSAIELFNTNKIDAVISTSPPVITHLIARKLKKMFNVTWIADMRDPWNQIFVDERSCIRKYLDKDLEIRTLSEANAIVSVTSPYTERIKTLHKDKKMYCISNGFDPDEINTQSFKLNEKFTITYTGNLYSGKRDPSLLFRALMQLIEEKKINRELLEIRLYTKRQNWITDEIKKHNLENIVHVYDPVPRENALQMQRESQLLLLIRWHTKEERGDCPAKIYEYFTAKRPIIAIGGHGGIVENLLKSTNAGKFADNVETLKSILYDYYQEFHITGEIKCNTNENIKEYSYDTVAHKYSDMLNKTVLDE